MHKGQKESERCEAPCAAESRSSRPLAPAKAPPRTGRQPALPKPDFQARRAKAAVRAMSRGTLKMQEGPRKAERQPPASSVSAVRRRRRAAQRRTSLRLWQGRVSHGGPITSRQPHAPPPLSAAAGRPCRAALPAGPYWLEASEPRGHPRSSSCSVRTRGRVHVRFQRHGARGLCAGAAASCGPCSVSSQRVEGCALARRPRSRASATNPPGSDSSAGALWPLLTAVEGARAAPR